MFQQLTKAITGSAEQFGNDARLVHGLCIATLIATVLSVPVDNFLQLNPLMNQLCLLSGSIAAIAWYAGRIQRHFYFCFFLLMVSQIITLTAGYIYNAGAGGPSIFFYTALIPLYLFILESKPGIVCSLVMFTNLTSLYLLDLYGIIIPDDYRTHTSRIIDLFAFQSLCILLLVIITFFAKRLVQIEKEKVLASSKAKTQFLANISHEIRTPMNAILGMNELALSRCADDQQKNWLQTSQVAAQHLLSLMEDMLDISSIDEGKLVTFNHPFSLRDTVTSVVNMLREFALQKNLLLEVAFSNDLPAIIETDPIRLRQVLVNLLNNAIKFTDSGAIRLFVSTKKLDKESATLLFSLCDTGIGIHKDQHQQIFEIFTQGKNIDAFRHKGSGLGLSISKQLVEKMGGIIWLESQPDHGSTFFFTLPVKVIATDNSVTDNDDDLTEVTAAPSDTTAKDKHLLLVEDNDINIDVARHLLQKSGFTLDAVVNGNQALSKLATKKYAAILMDLEMPVMDGFKTTQALRTGLAGSLNQRTPVIALTAHALNEYREKSFIAGMEGFITKPINGELMVTEINRIIVEHS